MEREQNTDELLAIRFPYSHHLFPMIESACEEIVHEEGWGRISLDFQGLRAGKLVTRFIDLQRRIFHRDDKSKHGNG